MSFLGSLVRYFDGRERDSAPARLLSSPQQGGVPVWVVLTVDAKVLADSFEDGKKNVGFPYYPNELTHYERVMRAAVPALTADEIALLMKELRESGPQKK